MVDTEANFQWCLQCSDTSFVIGPLVRNILIIRKLEMPIKQIRSSNKQRRLYDKPFILESFGLTTSLGFEVLRDLFHFCGTNELFFLLQLTAGLNLTKAEVCFSMFALRALCELSASCYGKIDTPGSSLFIYICSN